MIKNSNQLIKKWFSNEKEALTAFYQKKLTIHSPILVRYSIDNFKVKIENNRLYFSDNLTSLKINTTEIKIHKIFQIEKTTKKFYLITTIGILIAHNITDSNYEITNLFMETTPGRLIFNNNFKNAIK
jgi:hypothetical protein